MLEWRWRCCTPSTPPTTELRAPAARRHFFDIGNSPELAACIDFSLRYSSFRFPPAQHVHAHSVREPVLHSPSSSDLLHIKDMRSLPEHAAKSRLSTSPSRGFVHGRPDKTKRLDASSSVLQDEAIEQPVACRKPSRRRHRRRAISSERERGRCVESGDDENEVRNEHTMRY